MMWWSWLCKLWLIASNFSVLLASGLLGLNRRAVEADWLQPLCTAIKSFRFTLETLTTARLISALYIKKPLVEIHVEAEPSPKTMQSLANSTHSWDHIHQWLKSNNNKTPMCIFSLTFQILCFFTFHALLSKIDALPPSMKWIRYMPSNMTHP